MPNSGYFDVPFGVDGPLTTVPDAIQPDGSVSYTGGYGINYTLQPGTSGALNVENTKLNQILNDITTAIQNYQQNGIPPFITSAMNNGTPFSYAQFAMVIYDGVAYQSNVSGNTDTPPSTKWNPIVLSSPNVFVGGTSTGSANAQTVASVSPATGLSLSTNGQVLNFTAGYTNTGSTTLAVTTPAITATVIKKLSGASLVNLTGGELVADAPASVTVDTAAGCWVLGTGTGLGAMAPLNIGNNMANDTNGNAVATIPPLPLTGTSKTFQTGQWGAMITRSNSGTAMTDTVPGTSSALPSGWFGFVQNVDASATDVITPGSGGVWAVGDLAPSSVILNPGDTGLITSAGGAAYRYTLLSRAGTRTILQANTTFYVATTGNDSNNGLSSGAPWLTIQHAINVLANSYNLNGFNATIQLADGTYSGAVTITQPWVGGGATNVIINGDSVTPSNVVVSGGVTANGPGTCISIQNLEISSIGIIAEFGGTVIMNAGIVFGSVGGNTHIVASYQGAVIANNNYTISGGAAVHLETESSSTVLINAGLTVTLTGTPSFSQEFAFAAAGGTITVASVTWSGAATGVRYLANAGGIIYTAGAGSTFLPGNAGGSATNGGIYY
jgi:hypothetical protein